MENVADRFKAERLQKRIRVRFQLRDKLTDHGGLKFSLELVHNHHKTGSDVLEAALKVANRGIRFQRSSRNSSTSSSDVGNNRFSIVSERVGKTRSLLIGLGPHTSIKDTSGPGVAPRVELSPSPFEGLVLVVLVANSESIFVLVSLNTSSNEAGNRVRGTRGANEPSGSQPGARLETPSQPCGERHLDCCVVCVFVGGSTYSKATIGAISLEIRPVFLGFSSLFFFRAFFLCVLTWRTSPGLNSPPWEKKIRSFKESSCWRLFLFCCCGFFDFGPLSLWLKSIVRLRDDCFSPHGNFD